ncbi:MAG: hypothetical protein L0H59_10655 [Tomitella sp.]|nr:hypothetical protein [Tomitella sp.]
MPQVQTQTVIVLDSAEQETFKSAGAAKLLDDAVRPLQEQLKGFGKTLQSLSKGSPNEESLTEAGLSIDEIRQLLNTVPDSDARQAVEAQLTRAQEIIDNTKSLINSNS